MAPSFPSMQYRAPGPYASSTPLGSETPFYKSKTVRVIVPVSPGGSFDLWSRILARHLGKYLPGNPGFIVHNKPGGGGLVGANYLYGVAKPDGLTIGTISRNGYLPQLSGRPEVKYDWPKFSWIGATQTTHQMLYIRADAGYGSLEDVIQAATPPVCGSIGLGTTGSIIPELLRDLLGVRFKIVSGYRGGVAIDVAVARGELHCRATSITTYFSRNPTMDWHKQGFTKVLIQTGRERHPALPEVPTIWELAMKKGLSDDDRQLMEAILAGGAFGVPFVGPPGIPTGNLELLRRAFTMTSQDLEFRAEALRLGGLEVKPVTGQELGDLAHRIMDLPPNVVKRLRRMISP
ncbi:MAG: tripartite tricarboxylate transporter substrate-binding protein [Candidatus Binatia bacterium]|nr:tripartite tricarboxylate transporter substrate-binding protein [Candidatus Binatia bacterium]